MGLREWWRSFIEYDPYQNGPTKEKKEIDAEFVTGDALNDYETGIYGKLDIIQAELEGIYTVLPDHGEKLFDAIADIRKRLEERNSSSEEIEADFGKLQNDFDQAYQLANGEYKINELRKQNHNMELLFRKPNINQQEFAAKLEEFSEYINRIQQNIKDAEAQGQPVLMGVQKDIFYRESLLAEYRLKMLILMGKIASAPETAIETVKENPFQRLSDTKQKIFAGFLLKDADVLGDDFALLENLGQLITRYYSVSKKDLDECAQSLDDVLNDSFVVKTFSAKEIFDSQSSEIDSFTYIKRFVFFRYHVSCIMSRLQEFNEQKQKDDEAEAKRQKELETKKKKEAEEAERKRIEKEKKAAEEAAKEEAERKAEEAKLNRLKNMTNAEIEEEIKRIEANVNATGSRYVNILDFQKNVARDKGLLVNEEAYQNYTNLAYLSVSISKLYSMIKLANETGVNYTVFPQSQEFKSDEEMLFVVSNSDKSKVMNNSQKPFSSNQSKHNKQDYGTYTLPVLWMIHREMKKKLKNEPEILSEMLDSLRCESDNQGKYVLKYCYDLFESGPIIAARKSVIYSSIKQVYTKLGKKDLDTEDLLKDVKCYLSIPASRNMIPILEELKKAGIPFFMEPVPVYPGNRNMKNRDKIHIYFDREDLERCKQEVVPNVSTVSKGKVNIGGEKIGFSEALIEDCRWADGIVPRQKDRDD